MRAQHRAAESAGQHGYEPGQSGYRLSMPLMRSLAGSVAVTRAGVYAARLQFDPSPTVRTSGGFLAGITVEARRDGGRHGRRRRAVRATAALGPAAGTAAGAVAAVARRVRP
jgi:hypothetical protein